MEREVSLLRCSKLSCYSEFNRMVQAIARNGGQGDIPGTRPQKGTSAEYNFYTTLVLMLKQVISNTDQVTQKRELQRVYEWFCLNKPLIKPKTKPSQRKPKVSITKSDKIDPASFLYPDLDRPQTAPASLYKTGRSFSNDTCKLSSAGSRKPSPTGSRRRSTFTAMYVSRSLCGGLDLIGQTFDQLQLRQKQQTKSQEGIRPSPELVDPWIKIEDDTPANEGRESTISLIDLPTSDFLANFSPNSPGHRPPLSTAAARSVSLATVFSMAPGVAAQMTLERELNQEFQNNRRRLLSSQGSVHYTPQNQRDFLPQCHHQLVTTPETDIPTTDHESVKPMIYRESDCITTTIATENPPQLKAGIRKDDDHEDVHGSKQSSPSHQSNEPKGYKKTDFEASRSDTERSRQDLSDKITVEQPPDSKVKEKCHLADEKSCQSSAVPSEVQETMLDMKAVNRHSILSQVSMKQRNSPRTHDKEGSHGGHGMNLHIEGQAVRLSTESFGQRLGHKFASSTHREHTVSPPPMVTARLVHETKTDNLDGLTIRPVSLRQHSRMSTAPLRQDLENDRNATKNADVVSHPGDVEKFEDGAVSEMQDKHQLDSIARETSHFVEEEDQSRKPDVSAAKHDNKYYSSTNSHVDEIQEGEVHQASFSQNEEISNITATETSAKSEEAGVSNSVSQVTPGDSSFEVHESPIMVVTESTPTPLRPHSLTQRTSYLHQKSMSLRLPSPMNVVSLSFPSEEIGGKLRRSRTEGFLSSDATKKKAPTIIAGFNKKRYKRLKSPRAVEQYKVS